MKHRQSSGRWDSRLFFVVLCFAALGLTGCGRGSSAPAGTPDQQARLGDIVKLATAHQSDEVLISYVKQQGHQYSLNSDDILYLKANGVSQSVIAAMLQTNAAPAPNAVATAAPTAAASAAPAADENPQPKTESPKGPPPSEDDQLSTVASAAPPGATLSPSTHGRQRFSDQVLALLQATPNTSISSQNLVADGTPPDLTDRLGHSSDPLVRQIALLERYITVNAMQEVSLEKAMPDLMKRQMGAMMGNLFGQAVNSAMTSQTVNVDGYDVELHPGIDVGASMQTAVPLQQAQFDMLAARYELACSLQRLMPRLTAAALQNQPATPSAASQISVRIGEDPQTMGTVFVKNQTGSTLHHCLILIQGEQIPPPQQPDNPMQDAFFGAFAVGVGVPSNLMQNGQEVSQVQDRLDAMPTMTVAYRETLNDGEQISAPACMNGSVYSIKSASASVWADEIGLQDVPLSNLASVLQHLADVKAAEAAAQKAAELKAQQVLDHLIAQQHSSVYITSNNGMLLYQLLAYPKVWSEGVVAPVLLKHVRVAWQFGSNVQMRVDNVQEDLNSPACLGASVFRFQAVGDKPVPVAVRFMSREYAPEESGPFQLPPYPPSPPPALSSQQQARHDALLALINKGQVLDGTASQQGMGRTFTTQLQLSYDPSTTMLTGWIYFKEMNARKRVEGRIIDDPTEQPILQLVETGLVPPTDPTQRPLIGMTYSLRLQENVLDSVMLQKATYGDAGTGRVVDVTDQVRGLLKNNALKFIPARQQFPDPAPGAPKTLVVDCVAADGTVNSTTVKARQLLTLNIVQPAPSGTLLGNWNFRGNTTDQIGRQIHTGFIAFAAGNATTAP